jgi:tetratricopeptide (TPR) repeat protein
MAGRVYNWCEPVNHYLLAKLQKQTNPEDGLSDSKLTFYVPGDSRIPMNSPAVQSVFGQVLGQHYDQNLNQASTYSLSENTTITALVPPNGFTVNQLEVEYKGPELPPLSQDEVNASIDERRARALDHHQNGRHDQALPLLVRHLQVRPTDAEAHLKLAESYRARCCLNQAIEEYRLALQYGADDEDLRKHCLEGLQSLKVIPDGKADTAGHNMMVGLSKTNGWGVYGQPNRSGSGLAKKPSVEQAIMPPEFDVEPQGSSSLATKAKSFDPGF